MKCRRKILSTVCSTVCSTGCCSILLMPAAWGSPRPPETSGRRPAWAMPPAGQRSLPTVLVGTWTRKLSRGAHTLTLRKDGMGFHGDVKHPSLWMNWWDDHGKVAFRPDIGFGVIRYRWEVSPDQKQLALFEDLHNGKEAEARVYTRVRTAPAARPGAPAKAAARGEGAKGHKGRK